MDPPEAVVVRICMNKVQIQAVTAGFTVRLYGEGGDGKEDVWFKSYEYMFGVS